MTAKIRVNLIVEFTIDPSMTNKELEKLVTEDMRKQVREKYFGIDSITRDGDGEILNGSFSLKLEKVRK